MAHHSGITCVDRPRREVRLAGLLHSAPARALRPATLGGRIAAPRFNRLGAPDLTRNATQDTLESDLAARAGNDPGDQPVSRARAGPTGPKSSGALLAGTLSQWTTAALRDQRYFREAHACVEARYHRRRLQPAARFRDAFAQARCRSQ